MRVIKNDLHIVSEGNDSDAVKNRTRLNCQKLFIGKVTLVKVREI